MGTTLGALAVLFPVYGYWPGLPILLGIILIPFIITRNVALSMGIGLVFLPLITWLVTKSGIGTIMAVVVGLVIAIRFLPTARAALAKSKTKRDFIFDDGRGDRDKQEET